MQESATSIDGALIARMQQFVTGTKASVACVILAMLITNSAALVLLPLPPPPPGGSPSPAEGPVATCSNTDSSPLIQKSDCAAVASYLEEIGEKGTGCGSKQAYHDENGCTWMNTHGTCNANICDFGFEPSGLNCSTVAKYIRKAYNGCANDDGTLPAASFPIYPGGFVSVTYNGRYEQEPHP